MIFWKFHTWKCQKFPRIQNSEMLKMPKWQFLGLQNSHNWFHIKSEWQNYPAISALFIPIPIRLPRSVWTYEIISFCNATVDMSLGQKWQAMVAPYHLQKNISDPIKVWVSFFPRKIYSFSLLHTLARIRRSQKCSPLLVTLIFTTWTARFTKYYLPWFIAQILVSCG